MCSLPQQFHSDHLLPRGISLQEFLSSKKPKKKWLKPKDSMKRGSDTHEDSALESSALKPSFATSPPLKQAQIEADNGQNQHSHAMTLATAMAAEAAVAAALAAAEAVRQETPPSGLVDEGSTKEVAAIKIQAAFRGYLGRRGTVGLRGMVRLKLMANRNAVKRQTVSTLHRMQTLARIQSQIRERRIRLSEENQALHRQQQLKREKELQKSKLGEDWVHSPQSKEQFDAKLQKKKEAALRRERTLAYAYSHQWKSKSTRSKKPSFIDPANPDWGWSWLERWMAARPWETSRAITDKDRSSGLSSIKSVGRSIAGFRRSSTKSRQSPTTPHSIESNDGIPNLPSFKTTQIRGRRHSIGGAFCFRDEESPRAKSGKLKSINGGSLTQKQLTLSVYGEGKKTIPALAATKPLSGPPKVASYGRQGSP